MPLDRLQNDIVLIVDDMPDNLSLLHDALDDAGYTVLVATSGEAALSRVSQAQPDVILLDAVMPGLDGFEVARRLKASEATRAIPIIFMTGLTETEHVVAAFQAGSSDYVVKPIRPREVLARIGAHMQNARLMKQARAALDAFGNATLAIRPGSRQMVWRTPMAQKLLLEYFGEQGDAAPAPLLAWIEAARNASRDEPFPPPLKMSLGERRLLFTLHTRPELEEWLFVLREESEAASIEALAQSCRLTGREAEVLHWVIKGKTDRDVGEILGLSPRTVHKHLEHIFAKLGVETRTAAAALAQERMRAG